mmetsp:Transcript_16835/g.24637  ORF Transcript_16835/g.24637 Transcript_16835/m.24637 type:complete len:300 (+) Transcript_16835:301-1200(+)
MMTTTEEEQERRIRLEYERFMMGGNGPSAPLETRDARQVFSIKKEERKYQQIANRFVAIVKQEWIFVDDELQTVLSSILNVRTRLPIEAKLLALSNANPQGYDDDDDDEIQWRGRGYNKNSKNRRSDMGYLMRQDVELAFSHDLKQHERLMGHVRRLLSNLAQVHQSLGRTLDEGMRWQITNESHYALLHLDQEQCDGLHVIPSKSQLISCFVVLEEMEIIFAMLSKELYRKQCLAHAVINALDGLVDHHNETHENDLAGSGIKVASRCCREWPRGSELSCVQLSRFLAFLNKQTSSSN